MPGADAGDDADRHAVLHQRLRLFAAAPEDERIAALQPQHALAVARQIDQPQRDVALFGRGFAAAFAGIDRLGAGLRPVQDRGLDQRVIDDHIGLPQRIETHAGSAAPDRRDRRRTARPSRAEARASRHREEGSSRSWPFMPRGAGSRKVASRREPWSASRCDQFAAPAASRPSRYCLRRNPLSPAQDCRFGAAVPPIVRPMTDKPITELRRGWTTGACATAATKAALMRLWGGAFPAEVGITLPRGETPVFPLAETAAGDGWAEAGITKDAGDDPDVTHGALIKARVAASSGGVVFRAGRRGRHRDHAGPADRRSASPRSTRCRGR